MDNISKLVFGCLAMVGLIVMVIPNSNPLEPDPAAQALEGMKPTAPASPAIVAPPPPPPPAPAQPDDSAKSSGFTVDDYDIQNFGQPMLDPTPPAERKRQAEAQKGEMQGNAETANQSPGQPLPEFSTGQPQIPVT